MRYFSRLNPTEGVVDFWAYFRRPQPYRLPIILLSASMTLGIMSLIIWDEIRIPPPSPEVTYITTFAPDRTDAEILEGNLENQQLQDQIAAQEEARLERRRDIYRAIGRSTGMDVDAIDERVARERAAEEAAAEERRRELLANVPDPEEVIGAGGE